MLNTSRFALAPNGADRRGPRHTISGTLDLIIALIETRGERMAREIATCSL